MFYSLSAGSNNHTNICCCVGLLVAMIWSQLCSLIAPVVTTISIILSWNGETVVHSRIKNKSEKRIHQVGWHQCLQSEKAQQLVVITTKCQYTDRQRARQTDRQTDHSQRDKDTNSTNPLATSSFSTTKNVLTISNSVTT